MSETLLEVRDLCKYFPVRGGFLEKGKGEIKAVDGVSFSICEGETLSLVGESGCGKSTLGRTAIRLYEPTAGEIRYRGQDITSLSAREGKALRQKMQIIFQDPYSSLNPRMNIYAAISEAMIEHGITKKGKETNERVDELLTMCGLAPEHKYRYPHQFSGGQRQRIGIARALALNPEFIVCDEPVSALDVSIQSQIINLMMELQEKMGLSYLFISHDLGVVRHLSTRVGVMYLGSIVELAPRSELYENPLHPYTQALLSAVPIPDPSVKTEPKIIQGEIPGNVNLPSGCKFHTRCPYAQKICEEKVPPLREIKPQHYAACHFAGEISYH